MSRASVVPLIKRALMPPMNQSLSSLARVIALHAMTRKTKKMQIS